MLINRLIRATMVNQFSKFGAVMDVLADECPEAMSVEASVMDAWPGLEIVVLAWRLIDDFVTTVIGAMIGSESDVLTEVSVRAVIVVVITAEDSGDVRAGSVCDSDTSVVGRVAVMVGVCFGIMAYTPIAVVPDIDMLVANIWAAMMAVSECVALPL